MVRLNRIYTRSGDDGTTALGDGARVPKSHARIEAYGTVDELNAVLGLCLDQVSDAAGRERLRHLQNDLFDLGADLCVPQPEGGQETSPRIRVGGGRVTRLEGWIDAINADLPELKSFVLPGGTPAASILHLARVVCRRAERRLHVLTNEEPINPVCGVYLNRLSDLLFVMARAEAGGDEPLWEPATEDET